MKYSEEPFQVYSVSDIIDLIKSGYGREAKMKEIITERLVLREFRESDYDDLFEFSLESFKKYGYDIKEISYDLHSENIFNIMTEYEKKFSKKGIAIKYVKAVKIKKEE